MSAAPGNAADIASKLPPGPTHSDGLLDNAALAEGIDKRLDDIEMIGEEEAAGMHPATASAVTPGMRYLHCSRTIHDLITDRNRAVGIFLAVASLLWTASSTLLNAKTDAALMIPLATIQRWCLPATFLTLTILAGFVGFLLIRTRVGLIYEVAKMNVLLGLPVGRVTRINPLGIFFIMHLLISVAGGASAGLFTLHLTYRPDEPNGGAVAIALLVGLAIAVLLVATYIVMVKQTTADHKLQGATQR